MFLHLGNGAVADSNDIIAVLDMDNTTISKQSRQFLATAQKNGQVVDTSEDLPKSYVITSYKGETRVYITSVSSQTLLKRSRSKQILL